jgi:hypothetical protein
MGAHSADLVQRARVHAFASHRQQPFAVEQAEVFAQLDGPGSERSWPRQHRQRQLQRGETPFLHVMSDNRAARSLYERLGFSNYLETVVRVIAPL